VVVKVICSNGLIEILRFVVDKVVVVHMDIEMQ